MKETLKNFLAMVIATTIWVLGMLIILSVYYLFESGPVIEEFIFLGVVVVLFIGGGALAKRNRRIKTALEFPLIPGL